jgi:hypothetical protein
MKVHKLKAQIEFRILAVILAFGLAIPVSAADRLVVGELFTNFS